MADDEEILRFCDKDVPSKIEKGLKKARLQFLSVISEDLKAYVKRNSAKEEQSSEELSLGTPMGTDVDVDLDIYKTSPTESDLQPKLGEEEESENSLLESAPPVYSKEEEEDEYEFSDSVQSDPAVHKKDDLQVYEDDLPKRKLNMFED